MVMFHEHIAVGPGSRPPHEFLRCSRRVVDVRPTHIEKEGLVILRMRGDKGARGIRDITLDLPSIIEVVHAHRLECAVFVRLPNLGLCRLNH